MILARRLLRNEPSLLVKRHSRNDTSDNLFLNDHVIVTVDPGKTVWLDPSGGDVI